MPELKRNLWGEPEEDSGILGGRYVTIDGKRYEVISRSGDNRKLVVKECEGLLAGVGLGDEKVVEKNWLGEWKVRDKGIWD